MRQNWKDLLSKASWGPREWVMLIIVVLVGGVFLVATGFGSGPPALLPLPTRIPLPTFTATPTVTPTPTAVPATPTPTPSAVRIHVVRSGETLSRIAAQYGVTVQAIMEANDLTSTLIVPGQELIIP